MYALCYKHGFVVFTNQIQVYIPLSRDEDKYDVLEKWYCANYMEGRIRVNT